MKGCFLRVVLAPLTLEVEIGLGDSNSVIFQLIVFLLAFFDVVCVEPWGGKSFSRVSFLLKGSQSS